MHSQPCYKILATQVMILPSKLCIQTTLSFNMSQSECPIQESFEPPPRQIMSILRQSLIMPLMTRLLGLESSGYDCQGQLNTGQLKSSRLPVCSYIPRGM